MTRKHDKSLPKPPSHLSAESRKWWTGVVERFEIEPHMIPTLTHAAEELDKIESARTVIAEQGLFQTGPRGRRTIRPEVSIEAKAKKLFCHLVRELCLDGAQSKESRPPGLRYG